MDFSLRCNSLKCRKQVIDRAAVTTCSHVFCLPCSESSGLSNSASNQRACPACGTRLTNPDDAVVAQLNPSEDYKTSILSGLSPTLIMECAGRGLAFYSYQAAQEVLYQEYMARSLTDKYTVLSSQMDQVIHDANAEISNLSAKIQAMALDHENLEQRNLTLHDTIMKKTRAHQKIQIEHDMLKQRELQPDFQQAAVDAAEQTLYSSIGEDRYNGLDDIARRQVADVRSFGPMPHPQRMPAGYPTAPGIRRTNSGEGNTRITPQHTESLHAQHVFKGRSLLNSQTGQHRTRSPLGNSHLNQPNGSSSRANQTNGSRPGSGSRNAGGKSSSKLSGHAFGDFRLSSAAKTGRQVGGQSYWSNPNLGV